MPTYNSNNRFWNINQKQLLLLGVIILFLIGSLIFYPASMTNDTIGWIYQARTGNFSDVQPVGTPLTILAIEQLHSGPYGFVILNWFLILTGLTACYFLVSRSAVITLLLTTITLFYPAVFSLLGVAWRDITGAGLTVIFFALCISTWQKVQDQKFNRPQIIRFLVYVIILCVAGTLYRSNHVASALPILMLPIGSYINSHIKKSKIFSFAIASVIAFGILVFSSALAGKVSNHVVTKQFFSLQAVMNYHLALLSERTNQNLFPTKIYPDISQSDIEKWTSDKHQLYKRIFWRAFSRQNQEKLPRLVKSEDYSLLTSAYRQAIILHFPDYLKIRSSEVAKWFSIHNDFSKGSFVNHRLPNAAKELISINFDYTKPEWSNSLVREWAKFNKWQINRNPVGLMILAGIFTLLAYILALQHRVLILVAVASSFAHHLSVALVVALYSYRFGHQSNLFSIIAICLFLWSFISKYLYKLDLIKNKENPL